MAGGMFLHSLTQLFEGPTASEQYYRYTVRHIYNANTRFYTETDLIRRILHVLLHIPNAHAVFTT